MDDKEREQFKGMFTVNVIYLNILIFAIALAVSLGIIAPNTWGPKFPIVIGSIIVFVVFLILFIRKYRSTKAWLAIHGTTKEERMAQIRAEREAERARIRAELEAELREEIEEEKRREEEEKNA
ncbi:MAG: hypothetical protein E7Z72_03220 [Methanocorpusculum parvum]|nr:hypothetical protein [Methanocorpusculum parvum]